MEDVTDSVEELKIVGSPPVSKLLIQPPAKSDSKSDANLRSPDPRVHVTHAGATTRRPKFYIGGFHGLDEGKYSHFGTIPEKGAFDDPGADKTLNSAADKIGKIQTWRSCSAEDRKSNEFCSKSEEAPFDNARSTLVNNESQTQEKTGGTGSDDLQKPTLITSQFSASTPAQNFSASQTWQWFHAAFKKPSKSLSRTSSNSSFVSVTSDVNEDSSSPCTECHKLRKTISLRELNSISPTSW